MDTEIKMSVGKEAKICLQWDIESMTRAVEAVKVHNKGLRQAATEHGVLSQLLRGEWMMKWLLTPDQVQKLSSPLKRRNCSSTY